MNNSLFKTKYVSSFGIANGVKNPPKVMNKNGAQYAFNYNNDYGDSVYVRITDVISFFQYNVIGNFKNPIVLVTGDMDTTVLEDVSIIQNFLNHPKLLKWYAQNYSRNIIHPKMEVSPIGLDYHTLFFADPNSQHDWGKPSTPLEQEQELINIKNEMKDIREVNGSKAVTNFHHSTYGYPLRRQQYREPVLKALQKLKSVIFLPKQTRDKFWKSCNSVAFVVCPFGNGLDTHRTWEVLILGRIPIVNKCNMNSYLFEDLPYLEIADDEWEKMDEAFLQLKYEEIMKKWDTYNFDKLTLEYWLNKINN